MVKICHLMSQIDGIPNQVLKIGESMIIGRNRECRIRDIQCSRSYCSVTFDGNNVSVDYNKTQKSETLSNGQLLTGTGFRYKMVFVEQNDNLENSVNDVLNGHKLNDISDGKQFSYNQLISPELKQSKSI